jgi:hypothetical protein
MRTKPGDKRPETETSSSEDESLVEEGKDETESRLKTRVAVKIKRGRDGWDDRVEDVPLKPEEEEELERRWAFCCWKCTCSEQKKKKVVVTRDQPNRIQPGSNSLFHRRCCHNVFKWPKEIDQTSWRPPLEQAQFDVLQAEAEGTITWDDMTGPDKLQVIQKAELRKKCKKTQSRESQVQNEEDKKPGKDMRDAM